MSFRMPPPAQRITRTVSGNVLFQSGGAQTHSFPLTPPTRESTLVRNGHPRPRTPLFRSVSPAKAFPSDEKGLTLAQSPGHAHRHSVAPQRRAQSSDIFLGLQVQQEGQRQVQSPRIVLREFEQELNKLQNTCTASVYALKEGPRLQVLGSSDQREGSVNISRASLGSQTPSSKQDPNVIPSELMQMQCTLSALQSTVEEQQKHQNEQLSSLRDQWEKRFAILETAVSSGLRLTTDTASSMNERLSEFLRSSQALEGAVDRLVRDNQALQQLSHGFDNLREDVDRLLKNSSDEGTERHKRLADELDLASLHAASLQESVARASDGSDSGELSRTSIEVTAHFRQDLRAGRAPKDMQERFSDLVRDLSRESSERRQLARTVQSTFLEVVSLQEQQDAMHKQILKLSRELLAERGEVRKPALDASDVEPTEPASRKSVARIVETGGGEKPLDILSGKSGVANLFRSFGSLSTHALSPSGSSRCSSEEASPAGHEAWSKSDVRAQLAASISSGGSPHGSRGISFSLRSEPKLSLPDTIMEEEFNGSVRARRRS